MRENKKWFILVSILSVMAAWVASIIYPNYPAISAYLGMGALAVSFLLIGLLVLNNAREIEELEREISDRDERVWNRLQEIDTKIRENEQKRK